MRERVSTLPFSSPDFVRKSRQTKSQLRAQLNPERNCFQSNNRRRPITLSSLLFSLLSRLETAGENRSSKIVSNVTSRLQLLRIWLRTCSANDKRTTNFRSLATALRSSGGEMLFRGNVCSHIKIRFSFSLFDRAGRTAAIVCGSASLDRPIEGGIGSSAADKHFQLLHSVPIVVAAIIEIQELVLCCSCSLFCIK